MTTITPIEQPQWSPVMKTGNTADTARKPAKKPLPQWSPVMKTGNTAEYGREVEADLLASMEPGHEDREYGRSSPRVSSIGACLNGARS